MGQELTERPATTIAKSARYGCLALVVLWIIIGILIWPHLQPTKEVDTSVQHTLPESTATPEPAFTPLPTWTPLPFATPTPEPSPTPELLLRQFHIIQQGDTPLSIAELYNTSIELLVNRVRAGDFNPGSTIEILIPNPAACPSRRLHVVSQNETLFGLSRLYNTTTDALMATNRLTSDLIRVGDVLCLP